jgi:hypothetical protein
MLPTFTPTPLQITAERLKAVLLWSRALQFAAKAVQRRFGAKRLWTLVDWHERAVTGTQVRFSESATSPGPA